jgi:hypothetical protein
MARRAPPSILILPTATTVIFFFPWHTRPPAGRCHDVDFYICEYFGQVLVFEIDVGFWFHLLTFWAAIADVRFSSPAFMRAFLRTCQPKRLLQRLLRAKIAV